MKKAFVYLFLITIKTLMIESKAPAESIKLNILESCKDYPDAPIIIQNVLLNNLGENNLAISGNTIVREVVGSPLKMSIDIGKCPNKDRIDKCKHNFHPVIDDYCAAIEDREAHPAKYLKMWGLNTTCPILPGNYTFTPDTFNTDYLQSLHEILGNFWKTRIMLSDGEGNIKFCIYSEAEMAKREQRRQFKFNKKM